MVGDASTNGRLATLYGERDTSQIWTMVRPDPTEDFVSYWREHANSPEFTSLKLR